MTDQNTVNEELDDSLIIDALEIISATTPGLSNSICAETPLKFNERSLSVEKPSFVSNFLAANARIKRIQSSAERNGKPSGFSQRFIIVNKPFSDMNLNEG